MVHLMKVAYVMLLKTPGHCSKYSLRAEIQAKLPDDEVTPRLQQSPIVSEMLEQIDHEEFKIGFAGMLGNLAE